MKWGKSLVFALALLGTASTFGRVTMADQPDPDELARNVGQAALRAMSREDYDTVIFLTTEAVQMNRISPDVLAAVFALRGIARIHKGVLDSALDDLNSALKLKPDLHDALSHRGILYLQKRDSTRALADLDAAIRLLPNDPASLANRAEAYLMVHKYDLALVSDPK